MVEPIMGNLSENCSFQAEVVEYSFEQEAFQWKEWEILSIVFREKVYLFSYILSYALTFNVTRGGCTSLANWN